MASQKRKEGGDPRFEGERGTSVIQKPSVALLGEEGSLIVRHRQKGGKGGATFLGV